MSRVLVTGMSGVGKSTVLDELRHRGLLTVDTDYDGWVLPDGRWDEHRVERLLAEHPDVVVSGTVDNQSRFYELFEHIVLISAPLETLLTRLQSRINNPYGKSSHERAEVEHYVQTVEPRLRQVASIELDGRRPIAELADVVGRLASES